MDYSLRLTLAWLFSAGSAFFLLYFFTNSIATSLNTGFPSILGFQLIFPSPQGNLSVSAEYSSIVGMTGIITMLIINPPEKWEDGND